MDDATSKGSQKVAAASKDGHEQRSPDEIRREIEATRLELGETVEALAAKTDVKAQAKQRISAVKDTTQQKKDDVVAKAKEAAPDSASAGVQQAAATAQHVAATAQQTPLPFAAAGAFAAGVLIGWLLARR